MPLFWFLAGSLTTLALLAAVSPKLRPMAKPWRAWVSAAILIAAIPALHAVLVRPPGIVPPPAPAAAPAAAMVATATTPVAATPTTSAGPMASAIANLEARLAKGGGSADDWELLAKSFDFLDRPDDAAKARAHQLPALRAGSDAPAAVAGGTASISGEVTLDRALRGKASAGDTLFIVAKSVDSPGIPVAVFRSSVGAWPLRFTLDDSQSMLPGRTLSSAGKVTVEVRISKSGQPQATAGDLQGSSAVIDPAAHQPLQINIDRVI